MRLEEANKRTKGKLGSITQSTSTKYKVHNLGAIEGMGIHHINIFMPMLNDANARAKFNNFGLAD